MTTDAPSSRSAQQQPFPHPQPAHTTQIIPAASPPTKQSLKSWWKTFSKPPAKNQEHNGSLVLTLHSDTQGLFKENAMGAEAPIADGSSGEEQVSHNILSSSRCRAPTPNSLNTIPLDTPDSIPRRGFSSYMPGVERHLERSFPAERRNVQSTSQPAIFKEQTCEVATTAKSCPISSESSESKTPGSQSRHHYSFSNAVQFMKNILRTNAKTKPAVPPTTGIFGVPLRQSITYANVAISLVDAEGRSYIYGYVPIVVAKCGVYLKEKATNVEGIFRLSGSEKRIKELRTIFDSPDRYGKGLDWAGYTVHDAANVLRRYLNQLPEPIVPLDLYDRFRQPLKGFTKQAVGDPDGPQLSADFDANKAIVTYQQLITELPPLNRQLLLYILDLLAVFASKSDENRMTSANLSAIFQPGMLSHPIHDMEPDQYRLSQDVLIFLIENQDHFLIGMRGTAADEQTVADVQNGGTPPPGTPNTPGKSKTGVARSASNASAGADSVRKFGGVRRNVSVSSRHSKQSNGAPSPASPAYGPPLTHSPSGGIHRSNTVPSKRSPGLPSNRLQKNSGSPSPTANPIVPNPHAAPCGLSPAAASSTNRSVSSSTPGAPAALGISSRAPSTTNTASVTSQERLLGDQATTPTTPRNISNIFQRSPTTDSEKKQPNKLRKKRVPGSSNPSAQSSTQSLRSQDQTSPVFHPAHHATDIAVHPQLESIPSANPTLLNTQATPLATEPPQADPSGHQFPIRPDELHQSSDNTLKPTSPTVSSRSGSSSHDHSDADHHGDAVAVAEQREKRSRWRISRHHRESSQLGTALTPKKAIGSNTGAGASTSSVGSSSRPRKSSTADPTPASYDSTPIGAHPQSSHEGSAASDEKKGPLDWIKSKMREKRDEIKEKEAEKERNKSPPASADRAASAFSPRGKSMDIRRPDIPERPLEEPTASQVPEVLQSPQR